MSRGVEFRDYPDYQRHADKQRRRTFGRFVADMYDQARRGRPRSRSMVAVYEARRAAGDAVETAYKAAERGAIYDAGGGPTSRCTHCGALNYVAGESLRDCRLCGATLPSPDHCDTCGHDFLPGMEECPKCSPPF